MTWRAAAYWGFQHSKPDRGSPWRENLTIILDNGLPVFLEPRERWRMLRWGCTAAREKAN
jgi:hypothetical protein